MPQRPEERVTFSTIGEAHIWPEPERILKVDPPAELKAGVPYVFYIDCDKETVGIDHVSDSEWGRVMRGELPGEAVMVQQDMTLREIAMPPFPVESPVDARSESAD